MTCNAARRHLTTPRDEDPVHAAMGEFEAAHLLKAGYEVMVNEPCQHYQFAGRADLIAFDRGSRTLLISRTGRVSRTSRRRPGPSARSGSTSRPTWLRGRE